jgi:hypothetical protein
MKLTQHVPNFAEVDERDQITFTTLEEMLAGEWPARVKTYGDFHQFSLSNDCLMAEYKNGFEWWVVGYFSEGDPQTLGLPKWVAKDRPKANPTWQDIVKTRKLPYQ